MYPTISMNEFYQVLQVEPLAVLDVRERDEYDGGHIQGVNHLPLSNIQDWVKSLPKEKKYYVICQSGARSSMVCDFLANQGFTVVNIESGMDSWKGKLEC